MVENVSAVKVLLHSRAYVELAEKVVHRAKKKLCADVYDAELTYCQKVLSSAAVSLSDLNLAFERDATRLEEFCVGLVRAEKLLDVGQEFNPLEPDEQEEESETYVGHSQTFLLSFAVMYLLLQSRRIDFAAYLKMMRQPKAAKYQRGVESVFDSL